MSDASALRVHCREINLGHIDTPHLTMGPYHSLAFALHAGAPQGRLQHRGSAGPPTATHLSHPIAGVICYPTHLHCKLTFTILQFDSHVFDSSNCRKVVRLHVSQCLCRGNVR